MEATCDDGVRNGGESDVDCGGPCLPCAVGGACVRSQDCESGSCTGALCRAPLCTDGVHNGSETDIDCGGPCLPCEAGASCRIDADCQTGVCTGDQCASPACDDGVLNGMETDVDCGGPCLPCAQGARCRASSDCRDGWCDTATSTCALATSCDALRRTGIDADGTYPLDLSGDGVATQAYCYMPADRDEGWTLISVISTPASDRQTVDRHPIIAPGQICPSASISAACRGHLPPARAHGELEILIRALGSGDWIILRGFADDDASGLRWLTGESGPHGVTRADPLMVRATSGYSANAGGPLAQRIAEDAWWLFPASSDDPACGALVRIEAGLGVAMGSLSDAARCAVPRGTGHAAIFWR